MASSKPLSKATEGKYKLGGLSTRTGVLAVAKERPEEKDTHRPVGLTELDYGVVTAGLLIPVTQGH